MNSSIKNRVDDLESNLLSEHPAASLVATIQELGDLIERMSDRDYTIIPGREFTSSIGAQTRHTLDHLQIFADAMQAPPALYERRQRGTSVETDREAALRQIRDICEKLNGIRAVDLNREMEVQLMLHSDTEPASLRSTLGREIAFLLNHTIHHNALIAVMCGKFQLQIPDTFGFAPATIAWKRKRVPYA